MVTRTGPQSSIDLTLAALAHPVRRAMLDRLLESELSIGELSRPYDLKKPTISRHIRTLEEAGLIERTVSGRLHVCRINPTGVRELRAWLDRYQRFWTDQLDELTRYLTTEAAQEQP